MLTAHTRLDANRAHKAKAGHKEGGGGKKQGEKQESEEYGGSVDTRMDLMRLGMTDHILR
jgi:hypothetical protein